MNTTQRTDRKGRTVTVVGNRPDGPLPIDRGAWPVWASITEDDNMVTVTSFCGWLITDEVMLFGRKAHTMGLSIAHDLICA